MASRSDDHEIDCLRGVVGILSHGSSRLRSMRHLCLGGSSGLRAGSLVGNMMLGMSSGLLGSARLGLGSWLGLALRLGIALRLVVALGLGVAMLWRVSLRWVLSLLWIVTLWLILALVLGIDGSRHLVDHTSALVDGISVILAMLTTELSCGHLSHWRHLVSEVGSTRETFLEAMGEITEEVEVLETNILRLIHSLGLLRVGECVHALSKLVGHAGRLGECVSKMLGVFSTVLLGHLRDMWCHGLSHLGTLSETMGEVTEVESQFLELRLIELHLDMF
jgi:hypothetical protein